MSTDPKLVQEMQDALRRLGMDDAAIAALDLDNVPPDAVRAISGAALIPESHRAATGFTLVLDAVLSAPGDPRPLADVHRLACPMAKSANGINALAMIIISIASAAAVVLDADDDRTPGDFLHMLADSLSGPESSERFADLKEAYHDLQGAEDIRNDLRRIESDPDAFDDLLS